MCCGPGIQGTRILQRPPDWESNPEGQSGFVLKAKRTARYLLRWSALRVVQMMKLTDGRGPRGIGTGVVECASPTAHILDRKVGQAPAARSKRDGSFGNDLRSVCDPRYRKVGRLLECTHRRRRWHRWHHRHRRHHRHHQYPTRISLSIGVTTLMGFTITTTTAIATAVFEDRVGDKVSVPEGATVVFTSSDTAVVTVGTPTPSATGDGLTASLTPVAEGTFSVTATAEGPTGSALTPPIAAVTSQTVTVGAGPASQLVLTVNT